MQTEHRQGLATPVGPLLLTVQDEHLSGIAFLTDGSAMSAPAVAASGDASPVLVQAVTQLEGYFAGELRNFRLPLALAALPPFTRKVLQILSAVAYGETISYGELAARAGSPGAARAVGQVMAANPLPIVIPCHRVIAAGGRLGGYSGGSGLRAKAWLLDFERGNCGLPKVFFKKIA